MLDNVDAKPPSLLPQPVQLPPELLSRISGGSSPIEFGERIAAFVLRQLLQ